jgi:hypothetical protein
MTKSIRIYDNCFPNSYGAGFGGDNREEKPATVEWVRSGDNTPITVYTDAFLTYGAEDETDAFKVAWLIEPPSLSDNHYKDIWIKYRQFDAVLTFDEITLGLAKNGHSYPLGGSWISADEFGLKHLEKSKMVSMIASQKSKATGHKLRHTIAYPAREDHGVDLYGRGYKPIASKTEALSPYYYSIVIESWKGDYYFSEKLIDCICQGTIPIYWGCPSIDKFFDNRGIISFDSEEELYYILSDIVSDWDYHNRLAAIRNNIKKCVEYRSPEDWINRAYGWFNAK